MKDEMEVCPGFESDECDAKPQQQPDSESELAYEHGSDAEYEPLPGAGHIFRQPNRCAFPFPADNILSSSPIVGQVY